MTVFEEPSRVEWPKLLENFVSARHNAGFRGIATTIRNEAFRIANEYSDYLRKVARSRGITLPQIPAAVSKGLDLSPNQKIVMSGHQSVLYHPGLLYKELCLEHFAKDQGILPIHIVIDTDVGAAGEMILPSTDSGGSLPAGLRGVRKRSVDLTGQDGVFLSQKLLSEPQLRAIFAECQETISEVHLPPHIFSQFNQACDLYLKLAGLPVVEAHSIVRWALRGRNHLELPISKLLALPVVSQLLLSWVLNGRSLVQCYNEVLNEFRASRKIKNPANPFPNMELREGACELPFWIISPEGGERTGAVFFDNSGGLTIPEGAILAPRGSITTLLLRGFCCDLFIHGRGGAKYDPFVELFAAKMFGLTLAPFVVVSQDVRPFEAEFQSIVEGEAIKAQYKELVSHTAKYLDGGYFSAGERALLEVLIAKRADALTRMQNIGSSTERSAVAHELNAINREVRAIIDSGEVKRKLIILEQPSERLLAWSGRDYPFFLTEFHPHFTGK